MYRIRIQIENRILRRQFEEIAAKNSDFLIQDDNDTQRSDLLVLELNENPDHAFELLQTLLNNNEVDEIFLASETVDQNVPIKAMRSGAREFSDPIPRKRKPKKLLITL